MDFSRTKGRTWLFGALAVVAVGFGACAGDQSDKAAPEDSGAVVVETDVNVAEAALAEAALAEAALAEAALAEAAFMEEAVPEAVEVVEVVDPTELYRQADEIVEEPVVQDAEVDDSGANSATDYTAPAVEPVGQLGLITEQDNALSNTRWLSNPTPWDRGRVGRYQTSRNRDEDRAASLAARAKLRSFEGAPPAIPHSLDYSAASKTCLDCHLEGMAISSRVAHPMSHVPFANCNQCHVVKENKLYDELILPENGFVGDRPQRRGISSMEGAPPMVPHGTHMRTACLSCHGEFGYDGLKTDHPSRSNCMQCHITEAL